MGFGIPENRKNSRNSGLFLIENSVKMFEKYQAEVYAEYLKLKGTSIVLANPTPSSLRDEALTFQKNGREGDELLRFFTSSGEPNGKLDIDKFRPVQNFLIGKTNEPTIRVVEFVAWFINFQPRPFENWRNIGRSVLEDEKINENGDDIADNVKEIQAPSITSNVVKEPVNQGNTPITLFDKPQKSIKKLNFIQRTGIVATLGLIMGVAYWKGVPPDGCMYWTGTEYKAVDCDAQIPNTQILALNQHKLDHFKKITLPDTMTFNSLNKVWYSKINNEVEFFTTKGKHPLKTDRVLKPITTHILGKYGNNRILSLTHQTDTTEKD